MKLPAAFVIIMLLSTALTSTMSTTTTVRKPAAAAAMTVDAPKLPRADFLDLKPADEAASDEEFPDGEAVTNDLGASDHHYKKKNKCVSVEYCKKKREFCSKICSAKNGGGVETPEHVPDLKCFFKCKKCVPTC